MAQVFVADFVESRLAEAHLEVDGFAKLLQKPGVDLGELVDLIDSNALRQRVADVVEPIGRRRDELLADQGRVVHVAAGFAASFEAADGLPECVLEGRTDGHDLADRLHLNAQGGF